MRFIFIHKQDSILRILLRRRRNNTQNRFHTSKVLARVKSRYRPQKCQLFRSSPPKYLNGEWRSEEGIEKGEGRRDAEGNQD